MSIMAVTLVGESVAMRLKIFTGILILLLLTESGYIIATRHPIDRFKPVDSDDYLAFDSATGELCRTFRSKPAPRATKTAPSSLHSSESSPSDAILDMIRNGHSDSQAEEGAQAEFVRNLPACVDIH